VEQIRRVGKFLAILPFFVLLDFFQGSKIWYNSINDSLRIRDTFIPKAEKLLEKENEAWKRSY